MSEYDRKDARAFIALWHAQGCKRAPAPASGHSMFAVA
jgi:hypothetical protein